MMELRDTFYMAESSDYKERFKAEYFQLKIRYDRLERMMNNLESDTLTCSRRLYDTQLLGMSIYLEALRERAVIEGIDLGEDD